jgi:hypothetical protein
LPFQTKAKFTLEQAMKAQTRRDIALIFLNLSAILGAGGQRHAPAALPAEKRPGTHCIGGWVGTTTGLDGCGKSRPHVDSIPVPCNP